MIDDENTPSRDADLEKLESEILASFEEIPVPDMDGESTEDEAEDGEQDDEDLELAPIFDEPEVFRDFDFNDTLQGAIDSAGFTYPTPIQRQSIPLILRGRDILGVAQTGTGKTASFTLPILEILSHRRARAGMPRVLILAPTRELAAQIQANVDTFSKNQPLSTVLLVGGVSIKAQIKNLGKNPDILIATPGRFLDLCDSGKIMTCDIRTLIIDECDRMLDMGFIPDIQQIVLGLPRIRQTLMFSATMIKEIEGLAQQFLLNPKKIVIEAPSKDLSLITQSVVMLGDKDQKKDALLALFEAEKPKNAFIFCNRKIDVMPVARALTRAGYNTGSFHGDMHQSERTQILKSFKDGDVHFMVCSDVAARGIDVEQISHVFNYDVPNNAEEYVHRIGRTGRAGNTGTAIMLATLEDSRGLANIVEIIGEALPYRKLDGFELNLELDTGDGDAAVSDDTVLEAADKSEPGSSIRPEDKSGDKPSERSERSNRPPRGRQASTQSVTTTSISYDDLEGSLQALNAEYQTLYASKFDKKAALRREIDSADFAGFGETDDVPAFMFIPLPTIVLDDEDDDGNIEPAEQENNQEMASELDVVISGTVAQDSAEVIA